MRSIFACVGFLVIASSLCPAATPAPATVFFVENLGQWDGPFAFKYSGNGATYFLTPSGFTLDLHRYDPSPKTSLASASGRQSEGQYAPGRLPSSLRPHPSSLVRGHVLRLSYVNANANPELICEEKLTSHSNYFLSRDSCKWRSRVGHYRSVIAKDVWPGIDVEYRVAPHGCVPSQGVEAAYHVHPFANASLIQLRYEGQDAPIAVDANGCLLLQTSLGLVKEQAPFAYQDINRVQTEIPCHYEMSGEGIYRLALGPYDATREVVIDPLVYGSYWGGSGHTDVNAMARDRYGNKLLTGQTLGDWSFPITPGAYCDSASSYAGWITKFTPGGDSLLFSTFMGGGNQWPTSLATDAQGSVYAAGWVTAPTLPLTPDAFDTVFGGSEDGFISRYSADGARLEFSSYLGGSGQDLVEAIALDSVGDVYLGGVTRSVDFPLTTGALFPSFGSGWVDGFISVIHPANSALIYSTYFPGTDEVDLIDVTVIAPGDLWVGGVSGGGLPITANALQTELHGTNDAFFAHVDLLSDSLLYCSYLGGDSHHPNLTEEWIDKVFPLSADTVLLCGTTYTPDFPVSADAYDTTHAGLNRKGFLTMLALPQTLMRSTLIGGSADTPCSYFALDENQAYYVTGYPYLHGFPVTPDAYDTAYHTMFLARMSHDLRHLEYSTYIGGSGIEIVYGLQYENHRAVWLTGGTSSPDLPTTPNALNRAGAQGFLLCLSLPDSSAAVPVRAPMPETFSLSAYPNPFNPTTTISFTLPRAERVKLTVFDVLGREVLALPCATTNGMLDAGEHRVTFDGSGLSSGVYFARLQTAQASHIQKLLLLR